MTTADGWALLVQAAIQQSTWKSRRALIFLSGAVDWLAIMLHSRSLATSPNGLSQGAQGMAWQPHPRGIAKTCQVGVTLMVILANGTAKGLAARILVRPIQTMATQPPLHVAFAPDSRVRHRDSLRAP